MKSNCLLCIDLKTKLLNDVILKPGKDYRGVLRRDVECEEFRCDENYTFTETKMPWEGRRNPHLFNGKYISITRQKDGCLRLNFKRLAVDAEFSVEKYALGVYNDICMGLEGLVEK